jgi:hypothetical protein
MSIKVLLINLKDQNIFFRETKIIIYKKVIYIKKKKSFKEKS